MPHSKHNRTIITKHMNKLNKTIKRLKVLATKHNENAQIITVPIELGELRKNYSTRNQTLSQHILDQVNTFQRVPIDPDHPLFIYGKDGGLIAYRTTLNRPDILETLTQTIQELPKRTNLKFRGVYRGKYSTRHYCIWCPYSRKPFVSRELQEDDEAGLE